MYKLTRKKLPKSYEFKDEDSLKDLSGFVMNKNKAFVIEGTEILNITIISRELAKPLVIDTLNRKYSTLIKKVTYLLMEDDDSGESCREALNQIERFKVIIKNKYMKYLDKEILREVARQLTLLQKEADNRLVEIKEYYDDLEKTGKSR